MNGGREGAEVETGPVTPIRLGGIASSPTSYDTGDDPLAFEID